MTSKQANFVRKMFRLSHQIRLRNIRYPPIPYGADLARPTGILARNFGFEDPPQAFDGVPWLGRNCSKISSTQQANQIALTQIQMGPPDHGRPQTKRLTFRPASRIGQPAIGDY